MIYTEKAHEVNISQPPRDCRVAEWGWACFKQYGDVFYIKDEVKDGHHLEIHAMVANADTGQLIGIRCYETGGVASGWQACTSFGDNVPENSTLEINLGLYEKDEALEWAPSLYVWTSK